MVVSYSVFRLEGKSQKTEGVLGVMLELVVLKSKTMKADRRLIVFVALFE